MISIGQALRNLRPGAQFYLKGEKLTWLDTEQTEPTQKEIDDEIERLKKEWENNQYQRDRVEQYPSIEEQLDMQYHDLVNGTTTWKDAIAKVKTENPKSE